jgi:hypothetical protein
MSPPFQLIQLHSPSHVHIEGALSNYTDHSQPDSLAASCLTSGALPDADEHNLHSVLLDFFHTRLQPRPNRAQPRRPRRPHRRPSRAPAPRPSPNSPTNNPHTPSTCLWLSLSHHAALHALHPHLLDVLVVVAGRARARRAHDGVHNVLLGGRLLVRRVRVEEGVDVLEGVAPTVSRGTGAQSRSTDRISEGIRM